MHEKCQRLSFRQTRAATKTGGVVLAPDPQSFVFFNIFNISTSIIVLFLRQKCGSVWLWYKYTVLIMLSSTSPPFFTKRSLKGQKEDKLSLCNSLNGRACDLPFEVWMQIIKSLPVRSIVSLGKTSRFFAVLSSDRWVWVNKLVQDGFDYSTHLLDKVFQPGTEKQVFEDRWQWRKSILHGRVRVCARSSAHSHGITCLQYIEPTSPNSLGYLITASWDEKIKLWQCIGNSHDRIDLVQIWVGENGGTHLASSAENQKRI